MRLTGHLRRELVLRSHVPLRAPLLMDQLFPTLYQGIMQHTRQGLYGQAPLLSTASLRRGQGVWIVGENGF